MPPAEQIFRHFDEIFSEKRLGFWFIMGLLRYFDESCGLLQNSNSKYHYLMPYEVKTVITIIFHKVHAIQRMHD